ncbi:MAG: hypothetical protein AAFR71_07135 [Pseudomonadota bacterium]
MIFVSPFTAVRAGYFVGRLYTRYQEEISAGKETPAESDGARSNEAADSGKDGTEVERDTHQNTDTSERSSTEQSAGVNDKAGIDWETFKTSAQAHARALGNASYRAAVDTVELNITQEVKNYVERKFGSEKNEWQEGKFVNEGGDFEGEDKTNHKVTYSYLDKGRDAFNSFVEKSKELAQTGREKLDSAIAAGREQLDSAITSAREYLNSFSRSSEEKPDYSARPTDDMFVDPHESMENWDPGSRSDKGRTDRDDFSQREFEDFDGDLLETIGLGTLDNRGSRTHANGR